MRRHAERGFTMGELIVVLAIIAVLAAISTPMFLSAMQASRIQAAAEEVATALNGARQLALNRNQSVCVALQPGRLEYRPVTTPGTCVGAAISQVRLPDGTTVTGPANVTFGYLGDATPVGTYTVTNTQDGRTMNVTVSTSGRVRIGS
jgi:prepilin-type N-terminal cleavage/methylation domain-containing protein